MITATSTVLFTHFCPLNIGHKVDLSDVTLVILSHNRQHCLVKTMNFYKDTNLNLLVIDSSPSPLEKQSIPKNCNYQHSILPFAKRSRIAADLINTDYTIIGADDEIYLPSSLLIMRDFLKKNSDYSSVGGNTIAVWKYGPEIAASWAYNRTFKYHNDAETVFERIWNHTGGGINPLTSFFTCNLARTWAAQTCLRMYAKAPILATDAISILTICGAGKSKYLDLVYWIRNWNQSPKSHLGWNRQITLSDWWQTNLNSAVKLKFENELNEIFESYSGGDNFSESWDLILMSDKILNQNKIVKNDYFIRVGESVIAKYFKYILKRVFLKSKLPTSLQKLTSSMSELGIEMSLSEVNCAARIVASLRPYKDW